jgi:hypothetical protein
VFSEEVGLPKVANKTVENLVRVDIFVLLFCLLFTSSMVVTQLYSLAVGLGTIDRLKARSRELLPREPPVTFKLVFGSIRYWGITYLLPINPVFAEEDFPLIFNYRIDEKNYCDSL